MCLKNIVIIGLGWLGLPLAQALKHSGYHVQGTVRTPEKAQHISEMGITCHCQDFNDDVALPPNTFPKNASWVITVPPTGNSDYAHTVQRVVDCATAFDPAHIIFTSSTGIYKAFGHHDEQSTAFDTSPRAERILAAEAVIKATSAPYITVLRLSGLIGPSRHPSTFWKKGTLPEANLLVNLVHQEDCIRALITVLEHAQKPFEIFNLCAPIHPSRADFYQKARALQGLSPLDETTSDQPSRVICAKHISERFGFRYQWPDLIQWLDADAALHEKA